MTEPAVAVQKAYDWNLWILAKIEKFHRGYRFSLGQNLAQASLDLLNHLVDASYQNRNASSLAAASRSVNRVRILLRLAKDLRQIDLKAWEFAAHALDEIGRMTGGWLRHAQRTPSAPAARPL